MRVVRNVRYAYGMRASNYRAQWLLACAFFAAVLLALFVAALIQSPLG